MTFLALLTKEMRLDVRRERMVWGIIGYTVLVCLLGWFALNSNSSYKNPGNNGLGDVGVNLYSLLLAVQLLFLVVITPAFTVRKINGEKEKQTYDLLLLSRLSAFSLVGSKLVAGFAHTLLLLIASFPLFSLVAFFGGITVPQIVSALAIFLATALFMAMLGLFCSALFRHSTLSAITAYGLSLFWLLLPLIFAYLLSLLNSGQFHFLPQLARNMHPLFLWHPLATLLSTYPNATANTFFSLLSMGVHFNGYTGNGFGLAQPFFVVGRRVAPWTLYCLITLAVTLLLFLLCVLRVRPNGRKIVSALRSGKALRKR